MDQIENTFNNIYSSFGGNPSSGNVFGAPVSGGGSGPYGVTTMDPSNPYNVGLYSNLATLMGQTAPAMLSEGSNLVNTGMGVTQGGLDMTGAGFGTTQTGLATLQPSIDFYTKLASGDPTAMTQALAPASAAASGIETNALAQLNQGGPRGGYSSLEAANLPTALAGQIGGAALALQPQALQMLASLGGEQAQIGATQAQIGQGVSGVGQAIAGTGTTITGQGAQMAQNATADALQKAIANMEYSGANEFKNIMQGIGSLAGPAADIATGGGSGLFTSGLGAGGPLSSMTQDYIPSLDNPESVFSTPNFILQDAPSYATGY